METEDNALTNTLCVAQTRDLREGTAAILNAPETFSRNAKILCQIYAQMLRVPMDLAVAQKQLKNDQPLFCVNPLFLEQQNSFLSPFISAALDRRIYPLTSKQGPYTVVLTYAGDQKSAFPMDHLRLRFATPRYAKAPQLGCFLTRDWAILKVDAQTAVGLVAAYDAAHSDPPRIEVKSPTGSVYRPFTPATAPQFIDAKC